VKHGQTGQLRLAPQEAGGSGKVWK